MRRVLGQCAGLPNGPFGSDAVCLELKLWGVSIWYLVQLLGRIVGDCVGGDFSVSVTPGIWGAEPRREWHN